jgi:hypothetical protein
MAVVLLRCSVVFALKTFAKFQLHSHFSPPGLPFPSLVSLLNLTDHTLDHDEGNSATAKPWDQMTTRRTQHTRGRGFVLDACSFIRQMAWVLDLNIVVEELPSILIQHILSLKRRDHVTFGSPDAVNCHGQSSFSVDEALPLPMAAFRPATVLECSRDLQPQLTQSDAILAGISHTRSNVHAFQLSNFVVEPRSITFPSPLLGHGIRDDLLNIMSDCSVLPSCPLVVPWEMRGELSMRAQQAAAVYIPNVKPGMTMAIGERWPDTQRLACGESHPPAAAGDFAERIGTMSARRMLDLRLGRGEVVHGITIQAAKHIGDGFLRTLADVSQQKCIRNVSLVKKRWFDVRPLPQI